MAIVDGRLSKGTRLPTVRSLAVSLQVNPNTVVRAYNELEIRGIVNTQQGSGTFISGKTIELNEQERDDVLKNLLDSFLANASSYGFSIDEITRSLMRRKGELKL
ncbi:MAG: GntR family transcriptional regulator [Spirochaetales bacterium]|nr:MAG: GntR family transcriptional regulator [Spirochaetales bacterium]